LKEDFITNPRVGYLYVPALPTDNPYLASDYIKTLEEAFGYDPILVAAYKEGNWDLLQSHANLITQNSLDGLKNIVFDSSKNSGSLVACDPAIGGDECVLKYFEDNEEKDMLILHFNDTGKIGSEAVQFMNKYETNNFVCDAIGIGKGVADYVSACGKNVIEVISSESAEDKEHFANKRSEMWNYVATKIYHRDIPYPNDEKTRRQLCGVKYKVGAKKFELVRKDITKKELGESPDRADAFVYGIWGLQQVEGSGVYTSLMPRKKHSFSGAAGY
jgi:phage terminase large subunit